MLANFFHPFFDNCCNLCNDYDHELIFDSWYALVNFFFGSLLALFESFVGLVAEMYTFLCL